MDVWGIDGFADECAELARHATKQVFYNTRCAKTFINASSHRDSTDETKASNNQMANQHLDFAAKWAVIALALRRV